jgi:tetratricopeptide (TPR) repeat protein
MKRVFFLLVIFFCFCALSAQTIEEINTANKTFVAKNWEKAAELYKELRLKNPYTHAYIIREAQALQNLGKYADAIAMLKEAIKVGPFTDIYWYTIATNECKLTNIEEAMRALKESVKAGWPKFTDMENDKDLVLIRDHPEFLRLIGKTAKDTSDRIQKWRADFQFLSENLKRLHSNPYQTNSQSVWKAMETEINTNMAKWPDEKIIVMFMKYAALAGEGHTKIVPFKTGKMAFHSLPFEIYFFKEGFYIKSIDAKYANLLGKKVKSIGNVPVEELYARAFPYRGHDNIIHHKKITPDIMLIEEVMHDIGASVRDHKTMIEIESDGNLQKNEIPFFEISVTDKAKAAGTWLQMNEKAANAIPFYLQDPSSDHSFRIDTAKRIMHLHIRYIVNGEKTSYASFLDSAFAEFDKKGLMYLLLDLRNGGGGNSTLNRLLITHILKRPALNRADRLYAAIGRITYSAAINLVSDMEFRTNATLIGEPTGSSPNYIGESSNNHLLPYSRLPLVISNRYHQTGANNSLDRRKWIAPSILLEPTANDYRDNNDPVWRFMQEQAIAAK